MPLTSRAPRSRARRRTVLLAALLAAGPPLGGLSRPDAAAAQEPPVVVYLVRHAERAEDGSDDPPISAAGQARAVALAHVLRDAGVTHLHTTDLQRTRSTAAPLASALGLPMAVYDPRDLTGLAARLRATPGRHLVMGHSNTTPALATALGGDAQGAIADDEFDRLYVILLHADGRATTMLLRYGEPWHR